MSSIIHIQTSHLALTGCPNITITSTGAQLAPDATEEDCITFLNSADRARVHMRLAQGDVLLDAANRFGTEAMNYVGGDGSSKDWWQITLQVCRFFPQSHRYEGTKHFSHYREGILYAHNQLDRSGKCLLDAPTCRRLLAQAAERGCTAEELREKAKALLRGDQQQEEDRREKEAEDKAKADAAAAHQEPEQDNTLSDADEDDSADDKPEITVEPAKLRKVVQDAVDSVSLLTAMASRDQFTADEIGAIRRIKKMLNERIAI